MKMTGYSSALRALRPGVAFCVLDDSTVSSLLETLRGWPDNITLPSVPEIESKHAELVAASALRFKISDTKAEAKRRIIAVFPGANAKNYRDKELTTLMRASRLLKKKEAGTATVAEIADLDALDAMAAKLESIIAASNLIEADIAASADPANFDVVNSPRWPA